MFTKKSMIISGGMAKLKLWQVVEIRAKYIPIKYSTHKLAKEYRVSQGTIYTIIKRITWNQA